ncbi:MAG: response regulator transcription factor [Nitratireductor sp.]|jgi:DNA-binding response OmpR family regulator|nr:response regulator transcription factor [Nitratireductor sp.]MCC0019928.1 response regulator transcription factor [Nitratireductor sp.]
MILFADSRGLVVDSYRKQFERVGETIVQLRDEELIEWLEMATQPEVSAVEAILVGETVCGSCDMARLRELVNAPVIALLDARNLQKLIALYKQGVDDVVNKPVHCEELVVRIAAIKKRMLQVPTPGQATSEIEEEAGGRIVLAFDGSDPIVDGSTLNLPRRERRILEYLASVNGRRVTKAQLFNAIYGLCDEDIDENVIESHISKLRKKLRSVLGEDPINSKRYLGYQLDRQLVKILGGRKAVVQVA